MTPAGLANKIVSTIYNIDNPARAMLKFGQAVCEYLCDATTVVYSWSAVDSDGHSDPMKVIKSTRLMGNFSCSLNYASQPMQYSILMGDQLRNCIATLKAVPPAGFSIPPARFATAVAIPFTPSYADKNMQHWLNWSSIIVAGFQTYVDPTPLSGSHGSYHGAAVMTTIL